jgi:hypothetical protein
MAKSPKDQRSTMTRFYGGCSVLATPFIYRRSDGLCQALASMSEEGDNGLEISQIEASLAAPTYFR